MPVFAAALGEDFCRTAAENAFRKLGVSACPYLLQLANYRIPSTDDESEFSRRRRRSALKLLAELHRSGDVPEILRVLMVDEDLQVALLACSICLPRVSSAEQEKVVARLIDLLDSDVWMFRAEVEDLLIQHYENCRYLIERSLAHVREPTAASLRSVMIKANAVLGSG